MIETNLILQTFGQPSPGHRAVVHPDCVGIVLKQNNFTIMALPSHEIFASFYREEFIQKQPGNVQMFNNGSNVSATIICKNGVGRPTQACQILTTSSVSIGCWWQF